MKAFYKRFKYAIWALGAGLAVLLGLILKGAIVRPKGAGGRVKLPDVPPALRDKVEAAHEEALVARVEARVKAEAEKEKLVEVATIDDGAERRKQLAKMLEDL